MVCISLVLSFGNLIIFGEKDENRKILGKCRENPDNFDMVVI